jgi:hypothetical protein
MHLISTIRQFLLATETIQTYAELPARYQSRPGYYFIQNIFILLSWLPSSSTILNRILALPSLESDGTRLSQPLEYTPGVNVSFQLIFRVQFGPVCTCPEFHFPCRTIGWINQCKCQITTNPVTRRKDMAWVARPVACPDFQDCGSCSP